MTTDSLKKAGWIRMDFSKRRSHPYAFETDATE
jgi:hypothetical protein